MKNLCSIDISSSPKHYCDRMLENQPLFQPDSIYFTHYKVFDFPKSITIKSIVEHVAIARQEIFNNAVYGVEFR